MQQTETTEFEGVPAWPDEKLSSGRDARGDNSPPLEERLLMEFVEDLDKEGITARVAQLLTSAGKVPSIDSADIAGKVGDLIKLTSVVGKQIEAARERHNRPLLNAQRSLKAKADGVFAPLSDAIAGIRAKLNAYMQEQTRKADEARRITIEEARQAQEAANAKASLPEYAPHIEAAKVEAPVARGDLGARVGTVTRWRCEIESVRKLPDRLLNHPKVIEALGSIISAEIRGGTREIKGVRIWSEQEASVR